MAMNHSSANDAQSSMQGMHGMHGGGSSCVISMLWNWHVMNACFISSSWRITSRGMFVGSCIGVILLVMTLEFLRRVGSEFDRYLAGKRLSVPTRLQRTNVNPKSTTSSCESPTEASVLQPQPQVRPTLLQHTARSLLHMMQFGVAYIIMLLAMYYNGYIIISILIGSFLGFFVFSWRSGEEKDACKVTVCCG